LNSTVANVILDVSSFSAYKHLQIRIGARVNRTAGGDDFTIRLNGDAGGNYSTHIFAAYASSRLSYGYGNGSMFVQAAAGSSAATGSAAAIVDILDAYDTSKNTVFRALSGEAPNIIGICNGAWYNTASLTSIQFLPVYGTGIIAGSRFSVYGIKG
jgi:hypothetical protein